MNHPPVSAFTSSEMIRHCLSPPFSDAVFEWSQRITGDSMVSMLTSVDNLSRGESYQCTGDSVLDRCLGGGYRRGTVTEVHGEAGSGKTHMLIQAAVAAAMQGQRVLFCVSEDVPVTRMSQIIMCACSASTRLALHPQKRQRDDDHHESGGDEQDREETVILERISFLKVKNAEMLCAVFEREGLVERELGTCHQLYEQAAAVHLVLLDSIAACCNGASDAQKAAVSLKAFALRNPDVAVVVANQVRAIAGGNGAPREPCPALGLGWAQGLHARLALHRSNGATYRTMRSVFSSHAPPFELRCTIDGSGIHFSPCYGGT